MKAECPMGHTENLSYEELARRFREGEFSCNEDGCSKNLAYEVDKQFFTKWLSVNHIPRAPPWTDE